MWPILAFSLQLKKSIDGEYMLTYTTVNHYLTSNHYDG